MDFQNKNNQKFLSEKFPSNRGVPRIGRAVMPASCGAGCSSLAGAFKEHNAQKWKDLPFNPKLRQRAKELRRAGNLSEVLFWNQIKGRIFLNLDFDRQKIIGNYIVDFYCKDLGIIIEIDGDSHNEKQKYDQERNDYFQSLGLKTYHLRDIDIKKNIVGVMEFLREELMS